MFFFKHFTHNIKHVLQNFHTKLRFSINHTLRPYNREQNMYNKENVKSILNSRPHLADFHSLKFLYSKRFSLLIKNRIFSSVLSVNSCGRHLSLNRNYCWLKMGNKIITFSHEQLDHYQDCTFFNKKEILK